MERRHRPFRPLNFMKNYEVILNQNGQNAPVATVLENSLGGIVWTRGSAGQYIGTLAGGFPIGKTTAFRGDGQGGEAATEIAVELPLNSADYVVVTSKDVSAETGQRQFADGLLVRTSIWIRVYE